MFPDEMNSAEWY